MDGSDGLCCIMKLEMYLKRCCVVLERGWSRADD